jgi:glycosyltransferase involved in cell wall biosynthesis
METTVQSMRTGNATRPLPVSIVTVSLNARPALERTVESLRALSGMFDEYIVVDGASRDGTPGYLASEPVVTKWLSEPDKGIYDGMNKGWAMARESNHVLFLGAGDLLKSLPKPEELAKGAVVFGDVDLEGRGRYISRAGYWLLLGNTLHHQALLVPKRLHVQPPFDTRHKVYADYDFNLRLLRQRAQFRRSVSFTAFASAGGVSHHSDMQEMSRIVRQHYGATAGLVSRAYLAYQAYKSSVRP